MKKVLRIITSPIVFIVTMIGMIVIPIGIMAGMMGLIRLLIYPIEENHEDSLEDILNMTFCLFIAPYYEARKWVNPSYGLFNNVN